MRMNFPGPIALKSLTLNTNMGKIHFVIEWKGVSMIDVVLATRNEDKIREIEHTFKVGGVVLHRLSEFGDIGEINEDGNSFYENALKKAQIVFEATKMPAIADDSGLEVDVLGGKPGIFSSRYAGRNASYADNIHKLIQEVKHYPVSQRKAVFRCVALFYHPDLTLHEEGIVEGLILTNQLGKGGFGYDPVFFLPELGKTFAELSLEEKCEYSHRGIAFRRLSEALKQNLDKIS